MTNVSCEWDRSLYLGAARRTSWVVVSRWVLIHAWEQCVVFARGTPGALPATVHIVFARSLKECLLLLPAEHQLREGHEVQARVSLLEVTHVSAAERQRAQASFLGGIRDVGAERTATAPGPGPPKSPVVCSPAWFLGLLRSPVLRFFCPAGRDNGDWAKLRKKSCYTCC